MAIDISDDLLQQIVSTGIKVGGGRGAKPKPLMLQYVRDLTLEDKDALESPEPVGAVTSPLAQLRHSHHTLARLLAEGMTQAEASAVTGYSQARISILKHDPAFQELCAYYAQQKEAKYLDVHERLATVGVVALEIIQERLEDNPDSVSTKELMSIVGETFDRSVAPTKAAQRGPAGGGAPAVNIQVNFVKPPDRPEAPLLEAEAVTVLGPGPWPQP